MGVGASKSSSKHVQRRQMAKEAGVPPHLVEFLYQKYKHDSGEYLRADLLSPELAQILDIDTTNPDQKLSLNEYIRLLLVISSTYPEYWLKELFRVLDKDRDGKISRTDIQKLFAATDKARGGFNDEQRSEVFFRALDLDHNSKLTCKEFVSNAIANDSIMKDLGEIRLVMRGSSGETRQESS